jgi:predicted ribosome quality control (RQC) complex YloA/Tae2 family protein
MRKVSHYIESIGNYIEYRVGQCAHENIELIESSRPEDVWFHIRDTPSCHVVATLPPRRLKDGRLRSKQTGRPLEMIPERSVGIDTKYNKKQLKKIAIHGAVVCKQYSKSKSDRNVSVMYTQIANVVVTTPIGSVLVDKYYTVIL